MSLLRKVGCACGMHGRVVSGCGIMGDGYLCLDCGYETYGSLFGKSCEPLCKEIWPEVEVARNKPLGIITKAKEPNPEFDAWFNSPLPDGALPPWATNQ